MKYSGAYAVVLGLHLLTVAVEVVPRRSPPLHPGRLAKQGRVDALRAAPPVEA